LQHHQLLSGTCTTQRCCQTQSLSPATAFSK
jgi:hypothetical protein